MRTKRSSIFLAFLIAVYFIATQSVSNAGSGSLARDGHKYLVSETTLPPISRVNYTEGHIEEDTIVGNFTGKGLDTLYVQTVDNGASDPFDAITFYLASPNKKIPRVELYGHPEIRPGLVNEGDLDGNGTCEVGYMTTANAGQWREYFIFTLVDYEWRHLVKGYFLETCMWFRHTGVEIAVPGPRKGTVRIRYGLAFEPEDGNYLAHIQDTILVPTFDVIESY